MTDSSYQSRPMFASAEDWLTHYEQCRAAGRLPWEPATRDELLLAESAGILALHPQWIPGTQGLALLDLPRWFGRRQSSFPARWRERLVQTLLDHSDMLGAVRLLVSGGQAS